MEAKAKRVVTIVIVVGAVIGLTFGLIYGLQPTNPYNAPGAPEGATNFIKVGLIGDTGHITGDHNIKGAMVAAREINEGGGVMINGTPYYFSLASENTYEAEALPDITKGTAAVSKLLGTNPHVVVGGFRTEVMTAYIQDIMDADIPFLGTGAATDSFANITANPYFFRVIPLNSSSLGAQCLVYINVLSATLKAMGGGVKNYTNIGLLYENLDWTTPSVTALKYYLPLLGYNISADIAFSPAASAATFNTYWQQIDANGTQIVLPLVSSSAGVVMSMTYGANEPGCMIAGINVPAQLDTHWNTTSGQCNYEITVQAVYNTSKTVNTVPFWNAFVGNYSVEPLYTAVGARDAMYLLKGAIEDCDSLDGDLIKASLEKFNETAPFEGAGDTIAFDSNHDLIASDITKLSRLTNFYSTLFCQWVNGTKRVLPTSNMIYPDTIATGAVVKPSWTLN